MNLWRGKLWIMCGVSSDSEHNYLVCKLGGYATQALRFDVISPIV